MKRIAVVTSGGDAPGMNAAVRAIVRTGIARGLTVFGIRNGYEGLIGGQFNRLGARDVGGIIGLGGTFLGTTRCKEMKAVSGQAAAVRQLQNNEIDALVVIGGDGLSDAREPTGCRRSRASCR
jgi:6-phosphofructokinase 1